MKRSIAKKVPLILLVCAVAVFGYFVGRYDLTSTEVPAIKSRFIKRVVGRPGDRVEIRDGIVYVNGTRLD